MSRRARLPAGAWAACSASPSRRGRWLDGSWLTTLVTRQGIKRQMLTRRRMSCASASACSFLASSSRPWKSLGLLGYESSCPSLTYPFLMSLLTFSAASTMSQLTSWREMTGIWRAAQKRAKAERSFGVSVLSAVESRRATTCSQINGENDTILRFPRGFLSLPPWSRPRPPVESEGRGWNSTRGQTNSVPSVSRSRQIPASGFV